MVIYGWCKMSLSSHYIYYKRNGTTYSIKLYTSISDFAGYTSHYIAVNIGGTTYYAPSHITSNSNDTYLRYRMNGSTYIVKNGYSLYQIPAGTYTPTAFRDLIAASFGVTTWSQGNGGYIQRTFNYASAGTHFMQNNKTPGSGSSSTSEVVRLYSYGSSPFHYYWLTGSYWSVSPQWNGVAIVVTNGNLLYGIGLSCGGQGDSAILRGYTGYPITLYYGLNIAS